MGAPTTIRTTRYWLRQPTANCASSSRDCCTAGPTVPISSTSIPPPSAPNPQSGQGTTYLRSMTVKTDAFGDAEIHHRHARIVPVGYFLTATATTAATAPYGDTSEFSPVPRDRRSASRTPCCRGTYDADTRQKPRSRRHAGTVGRGRRRWQATGVDTSALHGVNIRIADLAAPTLGLASGNTIWLDDNAAGLGLVRRSHATERLGVSSRWQSGRATSHGPADGGWNTRWAIFLGHDHSEGGVMAEKLAAGQRLGLDGLCIEGIAPYSDSNKKATSFRN